MTLVTTHDIASADPEWVAEALSLIAANMRQQDKDEIEAMHGGDPEEALIQSVLYSTLGWLVCDPEGAPVAAFGVAPHSLPGVGVVWMLGTDGVRRHGYSIARQTRPHLDLMFQDYSLLWNYIDARNTVSRRWLQWGGFETLSEFRAPSGHTFNIFARSARCLSRAAPAASTSL